MGITFMLIATRDSYKNLAALVRVYTRSLYGRSCMRHETIIKAYFEEVVVSKNTTGLEGGCWKFLKIKLPPHLGRYRWKHIRSTLPAHSGFYHYNYKGNHSLVLLAVMETNYKFIYDLSGTNRASSNAQVFTHSNIYSSLINNEFDLSPKSAGLCKDRPILDFLVCDDAFNSKEWIMQSFPFWRLTCRQIIFNYRLSRAWQVVENAFSNFANRYFLLA